MRSGVIKAALAAASLGLSYIVPVSSGSAQGESEANLPLMPNLHLTDGSGVPFALSRYSGAVIVVEFWSTSCGPCFRDLDALNHLQGDFQGKPLVVVPISEDSNIADTRAAIARQKLTFLKTYFDPSGAAAQTLNLRGLPTSFVVDRHGRVVMQLEGPQNWNNAAYESRFAYLLTQPAQ